MADEKAILKGLHAVRVKIDKLEVERARLYEAREELFGLGRSGDLRINQRVMGEAAGVTEPVVIRARKRWLAKQQGAANGGS